MQAVTTIGLDIAKSVFRVHGIDTEGTVIIRHKRRRRYVLAFFQRLPPCLVRIEACATSHHWSRELKALGHIVRLMPPAYVKPYVKRQKNDAADAEAICEAVTRANMRFKLFYGGGFGDTIQENTAGAKASVAVLTAFRLSVQSPHCPCPLWVDS